MLPHKEYTKEMLDEYLYWHIPVRTDKQVVFVSQNGSTFNAHILRVALH